jgi:hypothetical protein
MTYNETTSSYGVSSSNTITAFFENRSDAEAAVDRLVEAGILRDGIRLVAGKESSVQPTRSPRARAFGRSWKTSSSRMKTGQFIPKACAVAVIW